MQKNEGKFPYKTFDIIVAATRSGGIGLQGQLPWNPLSQDVVFFKRETADTATKGKRNAVIMGHNTWKQIPARYRPLRNRFNVILTRQKNLDPSFHDAVHADSLDNALKLVHMQEKVDRIFVIGGGQIYQKAILHPLCQQIFFTEILKECESDAKFPMDVMRKHYDLIKEGAVIFENGLPYQFLVYKRSHVSVESCSTSPSQEFTSSIISRDRTGDPPSQDCTSQSHTNDKDTLSCDHGHKRAKLETLSETQGCDNVLCSGHCGRTRTTTEPAIASTVTNDEERQYLNLVETILKTGVSRGDRTGTGTISVFGAQMRFSLRNHAIPLLTTKRVFFRGVAEELLWMIAGQTDSRALTKKGVTIWDANGSRAFLDKLGFLSRREGDLGPVYGHQWRHFGAKYVDCETDYKGKGIDQLKEIIEIIKKDPNSRRLVMSGWNPLDIPKMALPPCHVLCQFYVANGRLSCQLYQRSGDMGLGVPFNIASYALLTIMIAHVCNLEPGDLVHTLGDTHIYNDHIEALKEQCTRHPTAFPKLRIKSKRESIDDFRWEDFELMDYHPQKSIKMDMAV